MHPALQALLAVVPILVAAVLLVGMRWPAKRAMPIVYIIAALIALTAWGVTFTHIVASTIQGLFITFDILYIIFGAILLLKTLVLFHISLSRQLLLSDIYPVLDTRGLIAICNFPVGDRWLSVVDYLNGHILSAFQANSHMNISTFSSDVTSKQ